MKTRSGYAKLRRRLLQIPLLAGVAVPIGCASSPLGGVAERFREISGREAAADALPSEVKPAGYRPKVAETTWSRNPFLTPPARRADTVVAGLPRGAVAPSTDAKEFPNPFEPYTPTDASVPVVPTPGVAPSVAANVERAIRTRKPIRSPRSPFVDDIDSQLARLRASVPANRPTIDRAMVRTGTSDTASSSPIVVTPSSTRSVVQTAATENPFETATSSAVEAAQRPARSALLAGANRPPVRSVASSPAPTDSPRAETETVQPVHSPQATLVSGEGDPSMIVEADSLSWGLTPAAGSEGRLLGAVAIVQTSVNQGIVLELEGPEDAPRMYPADIAMELKKPEAVPAYAEVPPAAQADVPPPPVIETGKSRSVTEFRPGADASNSSTPRPIRNVRWDDEAEPSSRRGSAGLPLSLTGGIAGIGLVALLAWARLRRRAAA